MNFPVIINNGIKNADNKKDLVAYLIREFKKAERDHFYTLENFFKPLFHLIEVYKKEIAEKFESNKKWYENTISKAKKNEHDYYDKFHTLCLDKQGIRYEDFKNQENRREFEERTKEFEDFSIEKVTADNGTYKLSEIRQTEDALKQAEISLWHEKKNIDNSVSKNLNLPTNTTSKKDEEFYRTFVSESKSEELHITTTERVLRELGIIELIFTAQYSKYDETEPFPFILDHTGRSGTDGRYIAALDVFSDVELLDLQLYKQHFTGRFESSTNHNLLKNQLTEIRKKAEQVRNYYNTNFTGTNDIVSEYVQKKKELDNKRQFKESIELSERHHAIITISNYHLMELYLGVNRSSKSFTTNEYTYSYISDNYTLASFCQKLIDFIDSMGIREQQVEGESASEVDSYEIKYSTDNYIEFREQKVYFPFSCFELGNVITRLREKLLDKTVCAVDLQSYPELIFDRNEFSRHPDLAGWIYNIIETWITDIEVRVHDNKKTRLFTSFLQLCRDKAIGWKTEYEQSEKQKQYSLNFEREFEKANIPFKEIIEKEPLFQIELFNQYCKAATKPCFDLYLADFYSQDELNEGFDEIHKQIPVSNSKEIVAANFVATTQFESRIRELYNQFTEEVVKKKLPLKYYCLDIEKVVIVQALRRIDNEYEILKKSVFDEKTDKYKEAEIRAKNIIEASQKIGGFAPALIEYLKQESDNIYLYINKSNNAKDDYWKTIKSNFNTQLSEFPSPQLLNTTFSNKQANKTAIKEKVISAFAFMQGKDLRKHKRILNETDFENLIDWVTYYFENDFLMPEIKKPIKEVNTNKENVIYTFKNFFKIVCPERTYPPSLFQLYTSCFYNYRNDKETNFRKVKEPKYYSELIKKN